MYTETAGYLYVGKLRGAGKVVDEWRFISPIKSENVPDLMVKVSVAKSAGSGISFCAQSTFFAEDILDTDIERLRVKVEAELRIQHDLLTGIVWEDWLEIEVRGKYQNDRSRGRDAELQIRYRPLLHGVDPITGKAFTTQSGGSATEFPRPKRAGESDSSDRKGEFWSLGCRDQEAEFSYLPSTPETIAGIESLMAGLATLRSRVAQFLSQDTVAGSLAGLATGTKALSSPISSGIDSR